MESKIIKHIKNKNAKGLDLLIDTYSKNIYYLVKAILKDCGNEEDIEECMSDIFIDIYNKIDSFNKEKMNFNRFIILRTKYNALEYKSKIKKYSEDDTSMFAIEDIELEEIINNQDNEEILKIIKSFKEPDRTYFYLKYFRDYGESEIAEIFNEGISSVQNKLYRCRFKIKNILEKEVRVSGK